MIFDVIPPLELDLNPLLQDPLLVIHPPMLLLVMFSMQLRLVLLLPACLLNFNKELFKIIKVWAGLHGLLCLLEFFLDLCGLIMN